MAFERIGSAATRMILALGIVAAAAYGPAVLAQSGGVEPAAARLLRASTDFLAAQQRFTVDTRSTIEIVLTTGQKLQFGNAVSMAAERPNKLWAKRHGDLVDQVFYYDGKTLTLHNPGDRAYARVDAPDTIEAMLDFARTTLDIVAPAGDFVYRDAYEILTDGVTGGFVVGKSMVEGVRCDHLAFRAPHADWQIWIQEGKQPLPRKIVITTRDVVNAPQFDVTMTKWNLAPKFDASLFRFKPPAGSRAVGFLPVPGATGSK
jgi:hypothetical protein